MSSDHPITYFEDLFRRHLDRPCLVSGTTSWTYGDFLREIDEDRVRLQSSGIKTGDVVIVAGDGVLRHLSLFFSLSALGATIVPVVDKAGEIDQCGDVANATHVLSISGNGTWTIDRTYRSVTNSLLRSLLRRNEAGLIMFTSGSTGKKKALLYSVPKVLRRFQVRRKTYRSLMFSSIDHFGGWNTIFYILSNGGLIVFPSSHKPDEACRLIQEHRIELLPTTPSFINLFLLSGAVDAYDLSSLRTITYGSEMMPEATLRNLRDKFPNVTLRQTYGLSELGQIKVAARDPGSLAVKVVGEGMEAKVIDGTLWVRSDYAMEGYLNGEAGFTDDGWFDTGDLVKTDGEFITFLGRKSELINVAGLKVYPAEVENFLLSQPGVSEALVSGEPNVFVGNTIVAQVVADTGETEQALIQRLRTECKKKLPRYMVPTRIHVVQQLYYSRQHKKIRISGAGERMPKTICKPRPSELAASMTSGEVAVMIGSMSEEEIRDWLNGLRDEELRSIHADRYDPVYLNLLAIFHKELNTAEIERIAAQCTRNAIWSNRVLDRWMDALPETAALKKKSLRKLRGLEAERIKLIAKQHHGLIICTFRFGHYSLLPFEIAMNGIDLVWTAKDSVVPSIEDAQLRLKARLESHPPDNDEDQKALENACRMTLLPVSHEVTSLRLLQTLRSGRIVLMHADGNAGLSGRHEKNSRSLLQFMGFPVSIKNGIANLAWTTKVPILPMLALSDGMDEGHVISGELISPPASAHGTERDEFVTDTMRSLYAFLADYGHRYPEQWPGVAAVHRWRRGPAATLPPTLIAGEKARSLVENELSSGGNYVLDNASAVAALSRSEDWFLVDMKSLKSFRPPEWANGLVHKLCRDGGINYGIIASLKEQNASSMSDALSLLAEFRRNGLIKIALKGSSPTI